MSGATIYTFCTSGGSSIDRSLSDLRGWYSSLNYEWDDDWDPNSMGKE